MNVLEDNSQPACFFDNMVYWSDALSTGLKPGYNCVPEQTIHFIAGYQEQEYDDR